MQKESWYIRYRKPLSFILLLILAGGIFGYVKLQKSLFPPITFPKIKIIADNGEQPVDKMMVTVTRPLEEAVKRVPGLRLIRSTTSRGSAEMSAFLQWDADIYRSQQLIESRINQVRGQLPPNTQFTVERMNPSILPVMGFMLEGKGKSLIELKKVAKYTIKPFLSQVAGVANVQVQGGKEKEYRARLKPEVLVRLHITPSQVQQAISGTGFLESNGYGTGYRRLYLTLTDARSNTPEQIRQIVIQNDGKRVIRLGDVAEVSVAPQIEYVKINTNGREGVLVNVVKQPGKNLLDLSKEINSRLPQLRQLLPGGMQIRPYYDQSGFVGESIRSVIDAIWIGLLFAIVITILYLRSFRSSMTLLITIPATLGLTLAVLYALGYTLNLMTLGAIAAAVGLIIDDAIVVVEQIHRSWEEHPDESAGMHIRKAMRYLLPALVGSSLTTIVIFFPFSLMSGVAGAYFKVLADTMIITLACSFAVVWIILPVLYLLIARLRPSMLRTAHTTEPAGWSDWLTHHPSVTWIFLLLLAGGAFWAFPRLQTGFLPEMDEGTIVLDYNSPPGTSLEETNRMLHEVDRVITANPAVANYSRRTGTQMGFFITEPNRGDYLIQLKHDRSKTTQQVINEIRAAVDQKVPGLQTDYGQVINDMLGDLMSSVQPIEVKIFGDDPARLQQYGRQVADVVQKVRGTADVFDGIVIAGPSVSVEPKADRLAYYGMTPRQLRNQLQTRIRGVEVGGVLEAQQVTPLRLIYPSFLRHHLDKIRDTEILLPGGVRKPLKELAEIKVNKGSAEVERENLQPMIAVTARLENRDLGSTVAAIRKAVHQKITLPRGYRIEYGGAYAEQQRSFNELSMILALSSLLVLTVVLFLFREIIPGLAIFGISILGMGGSVLALYLTGTPLNVGSYTGIIMVVGIIAENGIFTYYQFQEARDRQGMAIDDAINYSIALRLRPKLMTASAAIAALMPLALAIGTGAELHQPLAIAVIGGLLAALPLLLMVLPTLLRLLLRLAKSE